MVYRVRTGAGDAERRCKTTDQATLPWRGSGQTEPNRKRFLYILEQKLQGRIKAGTILMMHSNRSIPEIGPDELQQMKIFQKLNG
jgi:hypothetical protein